MDRRRFCISSAAATMSGAAAVLVGWPAAGRSDAPPPPAPAPGVRLHGFVFDRRYAAARAFGAAAEHVRSDAGLIPIDGDITGLWSRDLRPRWSAGGGAIAGMTTARTLFCLEQLAANHWMRAAVRVEHAPSEGNEFAHRLAAPEPMMARLESALCAGDWPARMPAALAAWQGADGALRSTRAMGSTRPMAMAHEPLVSFVIA